VRLAEEANSAVGELIEIQEEFAEAKEAQSNHNGPFALKCEAICEIDLQSAWETLVEALNAEVPMGFGRD
jgi:hypothetical protein